MSAYRIFVSFVLVGLLTATVFGQGIVIITPPNEMPRHAELPRHRGWPGGPGEPGVVRGAMMQLSSYRIDTTIKGQVATTVIDQEFYNPTGRRIEGEYLFPLPLDGHIDQFKLEIDGKLMPAEMLDADKAREIYEGIVRAQRDPALMEYYGQGLVRVRVFPIEANAKRRIRLRYTELLDSDSGLTGYRCPMRMQSFGGQPIGEVSIRVVIGSDNPLKGVYSPSHEIDISRSSKRQATVGFESSGYLAEEDFQLFFSSSKENNIGLNLMTYRDGEEGFFLLLASPGFGAATDDIANRDVVFVMDTSGSMSGEKIEQARGALKFCVGRLNEGDRFEVIRFSTGIERLFGRLTEVDSKSRKEARGFARGMEAAGSTAINGAMLYATRLLGERENNERPALVIFLTDGLPTIGERNDEKIVANVSEQLKKDGNQSVRIFCFGVGDDVNTYLLDKIAEGTRAFGQYILPGEDIEAKVSSFYSKIAHPVLTDVALSFDGEVKVRDIHPQALPDMFKGDQLVILGRYSGAGEVKIALTGKMNEKRESKEYRVQFAGADDGFKQGFIGQLWATRRIGFLLDQMRLNGKNKEIEQEISQLATRFGIVTPYTAYLILEDEEARALPAEARVLRRDEGVDKEAAMWEYQMLEQSNENLMSDRSGGQAVRGTSSSQSMRQSYSLDSRKKAARYANEGNVIQMDAMGGGLFGGDAVPMDILQGKRSYGNRETRFVKGRAFFRNGEQWVDANVSNLPKAKRVKVLFASDEYFKLLDNHEKAHAWMSVSRNVVVVFGDTIYEIVDEM